MKRHFKAFLVLAAVFVVTQAVGCGGSDADEVGCDDIVYNIQSPADRDGDDIADNMDNCVNIANSDQADADGDMVGDACDKCADQKERFCNGETEIPSDSCIMVTFNESTYGDCTRYWYSSVNQCTNACDGGEIDGCAEPKETTPAPSVTADTDGDDIPDDKDNCPTVWNGYQLKIDDDLDNDGSGNGCDGDMDGDGINNDKDVCDFISDPDQADWDKDGDGDKCDADFDNDGIKNGDDNCPAKNNPDQVDSDGDFDGDACDDTAITAEKLTSFKGNIYAVGEKWHTIIFKLGDKMWDAVAGGDCKGKGGKEECYSYKDIKVIDDRFYLLNKAGLFRYNEVDGSLTKIGQGLEGLSFWTGAVAKAGGKLIVAASQSGLYYFDSKADKWELFGPDSAFGSDKYFTEMVEYAGHFYVGTGVSMGLWFMNDQGKGLFVLDTTVKSPSWLSANAYEPKGEAWVPVSAVETQQVYGFEVVEKGQDSGLYAIARNPFHDGSSRLFKIIDHKMYEFDSPKSYNDGGESELEYTDVVYFEGTFYVATEYNGVWKRKDAGDWKQMEGLGSEDGTASVRSLVVHEGKLYAAITYWVQNFNFDGLFVLDNNVWTQADGGK